jgi:hypothetical protein
MRGKTIAPIFSFRGSLVTLKDTQFLGHTVSDASKLT